MAEVEVLSPTSALNEFKGPAEALIRHVKRNVKYKQQVGEKPITVSIFTLDGVLFTQLQLYIHSAFFFPSSSELFYSQYPFATFARWLSRDDYKTMVTILTDINQHCDVFHTHGIIPMIGLARTIVKFAKNTATNLEALKETLEIICDCDTLLDSNQAKTARKDATAILKALGKDSHRVETKCKEIAPVFGRFGTDTSQDEQNLATLIKKFDVVMPPAEIDAAMSKELKAIRTSLLRLVERQRDIVTRERNEIRKIQRWTWVPYFGPILAKFADDRMKMVVAHINSLAIEYHHTLAREDTQKIELIKSIDNVRGVSRSIQNMGKYIEDAKECLNNIIDGMSQVQDSAEVLTTRLDGLSGQVKPEAPGSARMSGIHADAAVEAWNEVLHVAAEFAEKGVILSADDPELKEDDHSPRILAAHYGGQDITTLANVIFVDYREIVIDLKDLPIDDPWPGHSKSLSLVYSFGDPATTSLRVFVGNADTRLGWALTAGDLSGEPEGVTEAANLKSETGGLLQIHAIVYGLRQITDPAVYERLYSFAAQNKPIPVNNKTFNAEGDKDPWVGVAKTAAVIYSFNKVLKVMRGRENSDQMHWEF